ncbi:MAG TPA: TadE/TadG family type IV pilus assembly protein [Rhizomicrobium sp.]|nr:TadE/TadG family type IV pilus assembly protein [Rhizomicrobium sp.]
MLGTLRRFLRSSRGNVAMIFAISVVPLIYLTGMGVDYGSAAMREAQLNAIADSASLAAVTPSIMGTISQGDQPSITAATNTFNAQVGSVAGVTNPNVTITVADTITTRTVTVSYTATSTNFFPNVLGRSTIALSGTSQAVGSVAPNINFYLLLDDSPSMGIPATQADITTLINNTSSQGGCAFACHESNPSADNLGNPKKVKCSDGTTQFPSGGEDNYSLAECLGLTLRIDNLRTAVENLTTTATTTEQNYAATYEMAVYTFDTSVNTISPLTTSMSTVNSDAQNIALLEVYDNNNLTSSDDNDDEDTNWDGAMKTINGDMPNPGNGTNAAGDTPQEVLFIVTDGMIDEPEPSGGSAGMATDYGDVCCGSRQQSTVNPLNSSGSEVDTNWCTTIKNRGIRIAVLYTEYYPLGTTNSWFNSYVAPLIPPSASQDNIGAQLQSCASPGLYEEVTNDSEISAALNALFQEAVSTAHLSK